MTEALEIRTPHADVSDVVRELAPSVDDLSIRLPCERPITDGEWVRFAVQLADGTPVFEGIGRSQGTRPDGPRYRVHLSLLQFDERNEVMYERMLLARDAEAERTGQFDLQELGAELIRGPSRSATPPARSAPPAPPPKSKAPIPPRSATLPAKPSAPPAPAKTAAARPGDARPAPRASEGPPPGRPRAPSAVVGAKAAAAPRAPAPSAPAKQAVRASPAAQPSPLAKSQPAQANSAPAKPPARPPAHSRPPSKPPAPAASPPAQSKLPPQPPRPTQSSPAQVATPSAHTPRASALQPAGAADEDSVTREHQTPPTQPPPHDADRPPRRRRRQRVPIEDPELATFDTVISRREDAVLRAGISLDVPRRLVERARALAPTLPPELTERRDASPEEAVLQAALRLGLASLAALADDDES